MLEVDLEFELKLDRIRGHANSKLENQKILAVILTAVEDDLKAQNNLNSVTAYFVSFLALLNQCFDANGEIIDRSLVTSAAYFLDLIFPFVPKSLLRSKFTEILVKLAPALTNEEADAPLIKSCIGALEVLLIAQDAKAWKSKLNVSPWRAINALLDLSLDPRPKIRKRAQEAIKNILLNPPASPTLGHVASDPCSEFALKAVIEILNEENLKKRNKKNSSTTNKEVNSKLIHSLKLIETISSSNSWSSSKIEPLCDILLEISKTNDQYLVTAAFSVFQNLFDSLADPIYTSKFLNVLNILFDLKPSINDSHLVGSWVAVIAKAIETYSKIDSFACFQKLPEIFKDLSSYLLSNNNEAVYVSAANCIISIVDTSIQDQLLLLPSSSMPIDKYESVEEIISQIGELITELLSVKYSHCAKEVMQILTNLINKLRFRSNPELIKPFEIVGQWRTSEEAASTLDLKEEEDAVICAAIVNLGADVVLRTLPMNLIKPTNANPGRAWLLPLLRDNVRNSSLKFYINEILPMIDVFTEKITTLEPNSMHVKVFETVIDQIWSLLPHFCDLPNDLISGFDTKFAEKLSKLLYENVELRNTICHALKLLIDSNLVYSEGVLSDDILLTQQFSVEESKKNIEYLSNNICENMLAVLFNVFSQSNPDKRGYILETIDSWLRIAPESILEDNFNNVCTMLKEALEDDEKSNRFQTGNAVGNSKNPRLSITMMDLIVALAKYVPESSYNVLFTIFGMTNTIPDSLIQKRSYRIITKLSEIPRGQESILLFINDIEKVMVGESSEKINASAKAARLLALSKILLILPSDHLYFIPNITSEIILATKDMNEKTRELAYSMLTDMGRLMLKGGAIDTNKVSGLTNADGQLAANFVPATISEYFTIVSAGLAGDSPHMISATITAISCLVYEFLNDMPSELVTEIASTVDLFLTSNNREIVKSTIGFVKVEVLSLPNEIIEPKLKELLEYLMRWSHEHKGHFKLRVKHIVERMVRRFGYETIEKYIPAEDMKLLVHIKKIRQRNKKKQEKEETALNEKASSSKFVSAYDKVLYDSDGDESEDEDMEQESDDERPSDRRAKSKQYIIEAKDSPLDLLDKSAIAHISSTRPRSATSIANKKKRVGNLFGSSADGKLVFDEAGNISSKSGGKNDDETLLEKNSLAAYVDAVKQGPVKGQRNRLKFKRGKNNQEKEEWSDENDEPKKRATVGKNRVVNKGNRIGKNNGGGKKFNRRG